MGLRTSCLQLSSGKGDELGDLKETFETCRSVEKFDYGHFDFLCFVPCLQLVASH